MNGDILITNTPEPDTTSDPPEDNTVTPVVEEPPTQPFKVGQAFNPSNPGDDQSPADEPKGPVPGVTTKLAKDMKPKRSKKKIFLIIAIVLLVLGGGGFAGWYFGFKDSGKPKAVTNQKLNEEEVVEETDEKSDLVVSSLSGVFVSPSDAARPVTGIMIENSGEARPQSGLKEADVIFEAIAEGGITRFLALFQAKQPDYIGPVRSARPYYVEWASAFDAGYAHAGGSPDGIARISQLGVKDINAFAYGASTFFRTTDRYSPHNLYTSFKGLDKVNSDKGYDSSTFTPWGRKNDNPQTALAKSIDIVISSSFYNVHYDYDVTTNTYLRSEGGKSHLDEKSGKQLAPNNVLVMVMDRSMTANYNVYDTVGSGTFVSFQDGVVSEGTWSRDSAKDQYQFTDKYGFNYLFNRGQTWVSVIDTRSDVSFVP